MTHVPMQLYCSLCDQFIYIYFQVMTNLFFIVKKNVLCHRSCS